MRSDPGFFAHQDIEIGNTVRVHGSACLSCDGSYYTDLGDLDEVDWDLLNRKDFRHDPDDPAKKERYQAEALIWKHVPLNALLGICSCSATVDTLVKAELAKRNLDVQSNIQRNWYF